MRYRKLKTTDLELSIIGIGGWAFADDAREWGRVDDNESIAAIQRAIDLGVTLLDTAPSYGCGHSEEVVGKAIAGRRDRVVLATKCGLLWRNGGDTVQRCLRPDSVRSECEESLRRLRVETIDLYQIHRPDPATPIADTMETLLRLKSEGKVRAIGACNFGLERLGEARRIAPVATLQAELSLLERQDREELLPYCAEYGVGVLAYSPLARGLLTGKFEPASRFDDLRARDPRFAGEAFSRNLAVVERLKPVAQRLDCTLAQMALAWAVQQPGVAAVLAGIKRISQIAENAAAGDMDIPAEIMDEIDRILAEQS